MKRGKKLALKHRKNERNWSKLNVALLESNEIQKNVNLAVHLI